MEVKEKVKYILESLYIYDNSKKLKANETYFEAFDEKVSYLKGAFLSIGSINDPSTSGYHLEFIFLTKLDADFKKYKNRFKSIKTKQPIYDVYKKC